MDEVVPRLAELGEVGDRRLVRLDQLAVRRLPPPAPTPPPSSVCWAERDGEVGADAGERVQRRLLRVVEAARQAGDRDDERDPDGEPCEREDGARAPADQLTAQVAKVEHLQSKTPRAKTALRLLLPLAPAMKLFGLEARFRFGQGRLRVVLLEPLRRLVARVEAGLTLALGPLLRPFVGRLAHGRHATLTA